MTSNLFARAMVNIRNAKEYLEVLKKEKVSPVMKSVLKSYEIKLNWIINDFHTRVSPETSALLKDQMFNMDSTLQIENINAELMDTTKEQREIIEQFIIDLKANKVQVA